MEVRLRSDFGSLNFEFTSRWKTFTCLAPPEILLKHGGHWEHEKILRAPTCIGVHRPALFSQGEGHPPSSTLTTVCVLLCIRFSVGNWASADWATVGQYSSLSHTKINSGIYICTQIHSHELIHAYTGTDYILSQLNM